MASKTIQSSNRIIEVTATLPALTTADSGSVYIIMSAVNAIAITIPAPATSNFGVQYTFINGGTGGGNALANACTISSVGTTIMGYALCGANVNQAGNTGLAIGAPSTSIILAAAGTAGDYIHMISNGVNWIARCSHNLTTGIGVA